MSKEVDKKRKGNNKENISTFARNKRRIIHFEDNIVTSDDDLSTSAMEIYKDFEKFYTPTEADLQHDLTREQLKELCLRQRCNVLMDRWNLVRDYEESLRRKGRLENKNKRYITKLVIKAVKKHLKYGKPYTSEQIDKRRKEEWADRKKDNILSLELWEYDRKNHENTVSFSESSTINDIQQEEQLEQEWLEQKKEEDQQEEEWLVEKQEENEQLENDEEQENDEQQQEEVNEKQRNNLQQRQQHAQIWIQKHYGMKRRMPQELEHEFEQEMYNGDEQLDELLPQNNIKLEKSELQEPTKQKQLDKIENFMNEQPMVIVPNQVYSNYKNNVDLIEILSNEEALPVVINNSESQILINPLISILNEEKEQLQKLNQALGKSQQTDQQQSEQENEEMPQTQYTPSSIAGSIADFWNANTESMEEVALIAVNSEKPLSNSEPIAICYDEFNSQIPATSTQSQSQKNTGNCTQHSSSLEIIVD